MARSPYEQEQDDGINIKCQECGRQVHAGTLFCDPKYSSCQFEADLAATYHAWAIDYNKRHAPGVARKG